MTETSDVMRLEFSTSAEVGANIEIARSSGIPRVALREVEFDRVGRAIDASDPALMGKADNWFVLGFRFDEEDQRARWTGDGWFPQGLSGTADANEEGRVDGEKYLLVSWQFQENDEPNRLARISIVKVTRCCWWSQSAMERNRTSNPSRRMLGASCGMATFFT